MILHTLLYTCTYIRYKLLLYQLHYEVQMFSLTFYNLKNVVSQMASLKSSVLLC